MGSCADPCAREINEASPSEFENAFSARSRARFARRSVSARDALHARSRDDPLVRLARRARMHRRAPAHASHEVDRARGGTQTFGVDLGRKTAGNC
ncbi:hypothetical protein Bcep1808_4138 [Burkholderia vietnamiensis G4]|uniref:Uncharacterized protein n=1 Tax=Burkholderia vietnamiensis (strain G4 / LMG 22486) TaxID=269482 RepID=A4JLG5_BURVG|nr:hypothetical protein Bcep1808_4138 [Burkholderia vietnamiensis G4]